MPGRPGTSRRIALAAVLAASVLVTGAEAGPWSFGASGGVVAGYRPIGYTLIDFTPDQFSSTWLWSASAERALGATFRLRAELSLIDYQGLVRGSDGFWIYDPGTRRSTHFTESRATIVPLAFGVRSQRAFGESGLAPYIEVMPTLFLMCWKADVERKSYSPADSWVAASWSEDLTSVVPGLTLGVGFRMRGGDSWSLDYGLQMRTSGVFHRDSPPGGEDLESLNRFANLALAVGFAWAPGRIR